MERFSQFLAEMMGLYYPKKAWNGFEKKFDAITKAFRFDNAEACIEWLMSETLTEEQITTLANHLTIGETYFFRDPKTFSEMETAILPALINERRSSGKHLRLWSAACCTGEEPYSYAMLLNELLPDLPNWNLSILGTDINPHFLAKAKRGVYSEWSFRAITDAYRKQYFHTDGPKGFCLNDKIKKMVRFNYLNLVEDAYPSLMNGTSGLDIIMCNNVLIYFSGNQIKKVVNQLAQSLIEGGYLVVTAIEAPYVQHSDLVHVPSNCTSLFQKKHKTVSASIPHSPTQIKKQKPSNIIIKHNSLPSQHIEYDFLEEMEQLYKSGSFQEIVNRFADSLKKTLEKPSRVQEKSREIELLIKSYANLGEIEKAKSICRIALQNNSVDPVLHYMNATIALELGDLESAQKALQAALFLDNRFIIAYFSLANIFLMKEKNKQADKPLHNALQLLFDLDLDQIVPHSEGLTVAHLIEMIENIYSKVLKKR